MHPAFESIVRELEQLTPSGMVLDAHSHLGSDEDGSSLDPERLLGELDSVDRSGRAVVFALRDPERRPAYRLPNDRVLSWARESDGRLIPFCRLNPDDDPVAEGERCLGIGARGIKLHPSGRDWESAHPAARAIFELAREAAVPILIHAGLGMRSMSALVDLALEFPEVPVVLAHGGLADQGAFASRLAGHPCVLYDTSCGPYDVVELFARVPAERIVFGSDAPYGRPVTGMFLAMRAAAYAGLDLSERALIAGGTMAAVLDRGELRPARAPRLARVRPAAGSLVRVASYVLMGFSAMISTPPPVSARALSWIALARGVCRDPDPGPLGPTLARIDGLLDIAEQLIIDHPDDRRTTLGLINVAATIAVTQPLTASRAVRDDPAARGSI